MMQNAQTLLFNRYSVLHIERTNSFNKVFFVLDTYQTPPRNCVVKTFEPTADKFKIIRWIDREFPKEAHRLKQLSLRHPNLPEIYTYSSDSGNYYLVRELIEGKTLREKVQAKGKLKVKEVKDILVKLLSTLDYIHAQGVIHQNIKPKNIILRQEDNLPMLINFGSIKQIVSTYGFYGDKQIFSSNNIYGYASPELGLGKPVPASDLYSLGLTTVYLLTAKNPVDLHNDSSSNQIKIPSSIASLDSDLARILARTISPNINDRYSSAKEMLDDLLQPQSLRLAKSIPVSAARTRPQQSNRWKTILYIMSIVYIVGTAIIIWSDWNLSQDTFVPQLPEPSTPLPAIEPSPQPVVKKPPLLGERAKSIEIPIFPTGTPQEELRETLGEPNAIQKGYWPNSSAWIYKNLENNSIDMGYLFDRNTNRLQQTEIAIAPSTGLSTIDEILNSLLLGNITPSISAGLSQVYRGQKDEYLFNLGNLSGSIAREPDNHIYLGVWESNFH